MSVDVHDNDASLHEAPVVDARRKPLLMVLIAVAAILAVVLAGFIGYGLRSTGSASTPSASSVDAGFARDMSTHHQQAITMAAYTRDNTTDPAIKILAYDIESSQEFQVGEMQGWLDSWGLSRESPTPMSWMTGHHLEADGLMPGMATPAQVSKLLTLHGEALNIFFLQLMLHHHQGGVEMAQYAQLHATTDYVRTLAGSMFAAQSNEILEMESMLLQRGAAPLPPPTG